MSETNGAEPFAPIDPLPPASSQEALSIDQAMAMFDRERKGEDPNSSAESAEAEPPATAEHESSQEDDSAQPDEAATAETQEDAPAEQPQRELPRSWSKDKAEYWSKLDPAVQDYLLEQDSKASAEVRRAQNEAAEARKAIEADKKAVEVERERYLKAASSDIEAKEAALAKNFPHIKTMDDVNFLAHEAMRLANTGNPDDLVQSQQVQAYIQAWRIAQDDLAVTRAQKVEAEQRQTKEEQARRTNYEQEQNIKLADLVPDMKDPVKGAALRDKAVKMLTDDLKIPGELLAKWHGTPIGHEILAHASIQKLIVDGLRYQELQKAPPKAVPKDLPPVQRPGVKPAPGVAAAQNLKTLENRLNATGSVDDAFALLMAQRRAS